MGEEGGGENNEKMTVIFIFYIGNTIKNNVIEVSMLPVWPLVA